MITTELWSKFLSLRSYVFSEIKRKLSEDSGHKSYEGAFDITICTPNYFEEDNDYYFVIELHCYVLGPYRHYKWIGKTFDDVLTQADNEIRSWSNNDQEEADD